MTTSAPTPPPGFEALLQALRAVGLPVGAREVLRLHHVFALAPALDQDRPPDRQLGDLLASALTHDPAERRRFEEVYEPWAERWREWSHRAGPGGEDVASDGERRPLAWVTTEKPPEDRNSLERLRLWLARHRRRLAAAAVLAVALAAAIWALVAFYPRPIELLDGGEPLAPPPFVPPKTDDGTFHILPPEEVPTTFTEWIPALEEVGAGTSTWRLAWPSIALGILALAAAAGLAWRWARKPWLPEILADPLPGPARLPLLPLVSGRPELLDPEAARTLVWGVGRHVTETLTRDLDLEATARETARAGGLPELRYAPEKRLREVWLWLDGTAGDPAMERWADEISASLARAGLPVRLGGFDGYPKELLWDEGQLFRPQEVEAHRQTALVAVCTDGTVIARHLEDERGPAIRALLRALAAWPRLAMVDFSDGGALAALLRPLGLACVTPDDLPAFFGLGAAPAPLRTEVDPGELRVWRAALALGARPVDRSTAYAIRRELALDLSPWAFHLLCGDGEEQDETLPRSAGGGLTWTPGGRRALVAWLAESSLAETGGLREGSLLERALDFWQRRLEGEGEERGLRGSLDPWEDRPAERHLKMEQALLRLWREPAEAAEELFALRSGDLANALPGRLGELAPRDCTDPEDGLIPLPWGLEDLSDRARYLLAELGLGGVTRGDLRRPGRLGWALGLLAGVGLLLGVEGVLKLQVSEVSMILELGEQPPEEAQPFSRIATGELTTAYAGTARGPVVSVPVTSGDVTVSWIRRDDSPCITGFGEAQLWRCGSSPHAAMTRDIGPWPRRALALVSASTADPAARSLAARLIDSGSADAVLLGLEAESRLPELLGIPDADQQMDRLLIIQGPGAPTVSRDRAISAVGRVASVAAPDLGDLEASLAVQWGIVSLKDVWGPYLISPASAIKLSNCPRQEGVHEKTKMPFVRVCGGTFRMGSENDDLSWGKETPAHDVTVGDFWIGQTEVTNAQYRVFRPGHDAGEAPDLPAVNVSWIDARDYCESLGQSGDWEYDLPTEAEWEHATRAGTTSAWSFGDDESALGAYAWFGEDFSESKVHLVGEKEPNPWGLYDVHGNAWEWVRNCYEDYADRAEADRAISDPGLTPGSCHQDDAPGASRVLRGGAFLDGPRVLRSAFRDGDGPGYSDLSFGFRCVRRARRQS